MRILVVNNFAYVTGGADTYCLALLDALERRGHEVCLLATASEENVFGAGAFVPCTVTHGTRYTLSRKAQAGVALRALWNARAYHAMTGLLSRFRPDIVHAHKLYPQLSCAPLVAARRAGVPVVQTLHDYEFISASSFDHTGRWLDHDEDRPSFRALNTATFLIRWQLHRRLVTTWVAVSDRVSGAYTRSGIHAEVVPNFVDRPPVIDLPTFGGRAGIAFIGRLRPEKGIDTVIDLARCLPEVPVTMAGWGPLADRVEAAASTLPNLSFAGRIDREGVAKLLRAARVLVLPSGWEEPGALSVLEAFAEGTPVVTFDRGGTADYVRMSGAGAVANPTLEALTEACRALVEDGALWARSSTAAVTAAAGTFSLHSHLHLLERVYERAIAAS